MRSLDGEAIIFPENVGSESSDIAVADSDSALDVLKTVKISCGTLCPLLNSKSQPEGLP